MWSSAQASARALGDAFGDVGPNPSLGVSWLWSAPISRKLSTMQNALSVYLNHQIALAGI